MMGKIFISTFNGVYICQQEAGRWEVVDHALEGHRATSVAAAGEVVLAGTQKGLYRSQDGGESWHEVVAGLSVSHVRWLDFHPDQAELCFVGTEPAAIFRSQDGGQTWGERPEVFALRREHRWSLPYSPEAGAVRGFALHGERAYAAVEVGGVLVSTDRGDSWELAQGNQGGVIYNPSPGRIHSDVHSIAVHPMDPDFVAAPTGGGFFRSIDGGANWDKIYPPCYARAVWLDPGDRDHMILGPADGVDRNGRVEETRDGGQTWDAASQGLDVPWSRHMVERFLQVDDGLLAVLSNGALYAAPLGTLTWQRILPDLEHVTAVAQA